MIRSALYVGELIHTRRDRFARRTFRYPMYTAAIELDELPRLAAELRLFAHNRRHLFALHDRDYRDGATLGLAGAHRARLAAAGLIPARTTLVTQLRVADYVFNPVSFFLDRDDDGRLIHAVAEVNNNYGGNHPYVLGPAQQIAGRVPTYRVPKAFFVSPFLHGPATYDFAFAVDDPARLAITMHVRDGLGAPIFHADLRGVRRPLTDRTLAWAAVRYPFMTGQIIGLIYYEALKLHLRGVPFRRPGPDHAPTPAIEVAPHHEAGRSVRAAGS